MRDFACEELQIKVLDSPARSLSRRERRHIRSCPACADAVGNARAVGVGLATLAREAAEAPTRGLPGELKDRVRGDLLGRLGRNQERNQMRAPASFRAPGLAPRPREGSRLTGLLSPPPRVRRRLAWGLAAAALATVVGIGLVQTAGRRPVGQLEFATAEVTVRESSGTRLCAGVGQWSYGRASTLETAAEAMGIFRLEGGVRGALADSTTVEIVDANRVELKQGAVWVHVPPRGPVSRKGFHVRSPHCLVRVTGTSFGVSVEGGETRVEVTEGTVAVGRPGEETTVTAGERLRASESGFGAPSSRSEGTRLPGWTEALLSMEKDAHDGQYVPSLMIGPHR
ncbi:MAG TPA: FecR family protein [Sumerlaeia bacterium]|nr:FecR family protein [Sumerlaeia bacterium]